MKRTHRQIAIELYNKTIELLPQGANVERAKHIIMFNALIFERFLTEWYEGFDNLDNQEKLDFWTNVVKEIEKL
jgi:hypothetical protein